VNAGKKDWLQKRHGGSDEATYWLDIKNRSSPSTRSAESSNEGDTCQRREPKQSSSDLPSTDEAPSMLDDKTRRLTEWISKTMERTLRVIVLRRLAQESQEDQQESKDGLDLSPAQSLDSEKRVIDEVQEIIQLPQRSKNMLGNVDMKKAELSRDAVTQLHDFVALIASMYKANPFHNFGKFGGLFLSNQIIEFQCPD